MPGDTEAEIEEAIGEVTMDTPSLGEVWNRRDENGMGATAYQMLVSVNEWFIGLCMLGNAPKAGFLAVIVAYVGSFFIGALELVWLTSFVWLPFLVYWDYKGQQFMSEVTQASMAPFDEDVLAVLSEIMGENVEEVLDELGMGIFALVIGIVCAITVIFTPIYWVLIRNKEVKTREQVVNGLDILNEMTEKEVVNILEAVN